MTRYLPLGDGPEAVAERRAHADPRVWQAILLPPSRGLAPARETVEGSLMLVGCPAAEPENPQFAVRPDPLSAP